MTIPNQEALAERARNLGALNGLRLVLVDLSPPAAPTEARLTLFFFNNNEIANILAATATPAGARQIFPISGGLRVPAGPLAGQVQTVTVTGNPADDSIELTVAPIGDYSVYTLGIDHPNIDPIFSSLRFKFRPGCFNTDCSPEWTPAAPAPNDPRIDYLAKDYDSFRHTMIAAMGERVPGWRATSEADLDQVLIDLISAAADELSDFQDRTVQEGYLGTARRRVSLARHARLMDYHIHEGNQASTWIALKLAAGASGTVGAGTVTVRSGVTDQSPTTQSFINADTATLDALLNTLHLYTWSDALPTLEKGATTADLRLEVPGQPAADQFTHMVATGQVPRLLVEEHLNPSTGQRADYDQKKRQLLQLTSAQTLQDPLTTDYLVRVTWRPEDALLANYCFTVDCTPKVADVSLFHANLLNVCHGDVVHAELAPAANVVELPPGRLAYRDTPPDGDTDPVSTLNVQVKVGAVTTGWQEQPDLIHSTGADTHFAVETDELGFSTINFGDGANGAGLPEDAHVLLTYQTGFGPDGNVGADSITRIMAGPPVLAGVSCWNPFDAVNGRAPEAVERIIRRAPEQFRLRQLRAVTLADYVNRAEDLPEVSRAAASYGWTGSWRTVRVAIDPVGGTPLDDQLRRKLARHLDAVRLIGEDLELRPPIFVPLEIHVRLCVAPEFWPEQLRALLEQEFSTTFAADGRRAFFHPDAWTFGQPLYASEILGCLHAIEGVEHVLELRMKRWNHPASPSSEVIAVAANEIISVLSDPDHMEDGFIDFDLRGGRS